jgi:hypothetical protein
MKFENREANYDFEIYRLYYKLVMVVVERFESQIIYNVWGASKPTGLNGIAIIYMLLKHR